MESEEILGSQFSVHWSTCSPMPGKRFPITYSRKENYNTCATSVSLLFSTIFLINMIACARMPTSYVKPSYQELIIIKNLAVTIEGNPDISHIGAITNESTTLILLFGPPAAMLDTAIRKSIDDKTSELMKLKEISSESRAVFLNTLVENLQYLGRFEKVTVIDNIDEQRKKNFDAVLKVKIINWGSRIKQSGSNMILPFIAVDISMVSQDGTRVIWNENQTITFDTHHTLDDYKQQNGLLGSDFTALMKKAGRQITELLNDF
jgi:hypothetical protein